MSSFVYMEFRSKKTTFIMALVIFAGAVICYKAYKDTKKDINEFNDTTVDTSY